MFTCGLGDFKSKHKGEVQDHEVEHHQIKCDHCENTFIGQVKLEKHMYRKHVPNPDDMDMYVKNWIRKNGCIPVLSKRMEKELVILHSENCWEKEIFCSEILENMSVTDK